MELTDPVEVVCDAGPLIHLDELGCLDLLDDFAKLWVPAAVQEEVLRHRPAAIEHSALAFQHPTSQPKPTAKLSTLARSLSLHHGELAALAFLQEHPAAIFLTDDAAARLAARSLGFRVHGTIAILLRGLRVGRRTHDELLEILTTLPERSTLHIRRDLLNEVLEELASGGGGNVAPG